MGDDAVPEDATGAGLTSAQVAERVAAGRINDVPARASRSVADIVRGNVLTRFNAIIGALFVIILVIGPIQDGLFGVIVIVNTAIGIIQELRAKRTLERLAIVGEARCRVRRDGAVVELGPDRIVLDDVIELGPGDKVVVDGAVTAAAGLEIDESLLTGEADPIHKQLGDAVMSGSFVVAGTGAHRATRVGREAYAARLAEEASKFTLVRSELRGGINRILTIVTWLFVPAGAITIFTQLRVHDELSAALRSTVAALSAMVPEGLVLLTSIAFALGVIRLGRRRCLVQELPAIEGLARVDVVCADKTGTLTEDGMRLTEVRRVGDGAAPAPPPATVLAALATTDPRPNASLRAIAEAYPQDPGWTATAIAPFSSARKWSGAGFAEHGSWVLGAPDVLLPEGSPVRELALEAGAGGLRVLLLGRAGIAVDAPAAPGAVTPVALVVLEQRVRGDAAETLRYFRSQDVEVRVISGDNAVSVGAVAASLGLPHATRPVDARALPEDGAALAERAEDATVFGRVTPAQKRAMVAALQSRGHTVAMTGDGVNDVLALKDADIGVAMGSGSPATRAVAQIVLLDDRFAALPHVVAEGRRVIGNIERVAKLFLVKTVYSVALAFIIGLAGLPFPFLPRHLTLIGALTIGIPAFVLALAPNLERARTGFVTRVLRTSVPAGVIAAAAATVVYVVTRADAASTQLQDQTAAVIALFGVSWWVLAIAARPWLLWRVGLVAAMAVAFVAVLSAALGRWFFALDPGSVANDVTALAVAAVGAALVEVAWRLDGRRRREPQAGEMSTLPPAR